MSEGIRIGTVDDIGEGEAITVEVPGAPDTIAVFHSDNGAFYALNDTCTHEEASLADGWIEGDEVECPLHSSRFCLSTGEVRCLPATRNTVAHRVEVVDGEIWLYPTI